MNKKFGILISLFAVLASFTACVSMDDEFPDGRELSGENGIVVYDVVCNDEDLDSHDLKITYKDSLLNTRTITIHKVDSALYLDENGDTVTNVFSKIRSIETIYMSQNNTSYDESAVKGKYGYAMSFKVPYGSYGYDLKAEFVGGGTASAITGLIHRRAANKEYTALDYPPLVIKPDTKVAVADAAYNWRDRYKTIPESMADIEKYGGYFMSSSRVYQDCYYTGYERTADFWK